MLKLLDWTRAYLAQGGVGDSRLAAELLLAHVLGCRRIELYTRFEYAPSADELAAYRLLVRRAAKQEPIAYLVGGKEFYSLRFKVTPDVVIPRPETELLVGEAIGHLRGLGRPGSMWDVCTGSGCVAVAVAANVPGATVLATDVSEQALTVAGENAAAHHVSDRVRCRLADLLSLPADCGDLKAFDVIAANPPYVADNDPVAETVKHEPAIGIRGGPGGLDFIRPIVRGAAAFLAAGGLLIMEFGFNQAGGVWDLVAAADGLAQPKILRDHHGIERALVATKRP